MPFPTSRSAIVDAVNTRDAVCAQGTPRTPSPATASNTSDEQLPFSRAPHIRHASLDSNVRHNNGKASRATCAEPAAAASTSAIAERMSDLNSFDVHLRLYRAPPAWSALEDALSRMKEEESLRKRQMEIAAASRARGGDGELAMVDITSSRAARVKRELDAVVQAAAKRRKLDYAVEDAVSGGISGTTTGRFSRPSFSAGSASSVLLPIQPLVNESTSRNPFRRRHPPAPGSIPASLLSPASSGSTSHTNINDQDDQDEDEDEDTIYDMDDNNDYHNDSHDSTKAQATIATPRVQPLEKPTNANGSGTGTVSASKTKPMIPISAVKVPILPSEMRQEALARERKESSGSVTKLKPKFKGASSKSANANAKPKAKSLGQFDWKTWGSK